MCVLAEKKMEKNKKFFFDRPSVRGHSPPNYPSPQPHHKKKKSSRLKKCASTAPQWWPYSIHLGLYTITDCKFISNFPATRIEAKECDDGRVTSLVCASNDSNLQALFFLDGRHRTPSFQNNHNATTFFAGLVECANFRRRVSGRTLSVFFWASSHQKLPRDRCVNRTLFRGERPTERGPCLRLFVFRSRFIHYPSRAPRAHTYHSNPRGTPLMGDADSKRVFRIVKGSGSVKMAKVPLESTAWFAWPHIPGVSLTEGFEPELEEDESDHDDDKPRFASRRQRELRARLLRRTRHKSVTWRARFHDQELCARAEATESKYFMLRESAPGVLEAVAVDEWLAFRPQVPFETMSTEDAEKILSNPHKFNIHDAKAMQPWRRQHGSLVHKKKSRPLSRLEEKLLATEEQQPSVRRSTPQRKKRIFDAEENDGIGLNDAGEDVDAFELVEGRGEDGIDFDQNEEFEDDEADEEKQDLSNMNVDTVDDEPDLPDNDDDIQAGEAKKKADKSRDSTSAKRKRGEDDRAAPEDADDEADDDEAESTQLVEDTRRSSHDLTQPGEDDSPPPSSTLLTEDDVRREFIARGRKAKAKEIILHFATQIRADSSNKDILRNIIHKITVGQPSFYQPQLGARRTSVKSTPSTATNSSSLNGSDCVFFSLAQPLCGRSRPSVLLQLEGHPSLLLGLLEYTAEYPYFTYCRASPLAIPTPVSNTVCAFVWYVRPQIIASIKVHLS